MPSDLTPTPETALIETYVRALAPGVFNMSCGTRVDGGYELWLQLNQDSRITPVVIDQSEFESGDWKDKVKAAIETANV